MEYGRFDRIMKRQSRKAPPSPKDQQTIYPKQRETKKMADPTEPQDYSSKIAEARRAMHAQQPKKMALTPSAAVKHLWIDDLRLPPDDNWLWAKSSKEALSLLGEHPEIGYIAFDFDLGESDTAMPVLLKIKEDAVYGRREPPRWNAHTANPVGRNHIETIMSKAMDYWAKHSDSAN